MLWVEWRSRSRSFALEVMPRRRWVRLAVYSLLYFFIATGALGTEGDFIYFQF